MVNAIIGTSFRWCASRGSGCGGRFGAQSSFAAETSDTVTLSSMTRSEWQEAFQSGRQKQKDVACIEGPVPIARLSQFLAFLMDRIFSPNARIPVAEAVEVSEVLNMNQGRKNVKSGTNF